MGGEVVWRWLRNETMNKTKYGPKYYIKQKIKVQWRDNFWNYVLQLILTGWRPMLSSVCLKFG